jgi:Tol biopolymer transport system component
MNLWRVAIDEQSGRVLAQPEPLTTPSALAGHLSVSADGRRVVYASLERTAPIQAVPFDPASGTITVTPVTVVGGTRFLSWVAASPDGQWLAYYSIGNQMDLLLSRSDGTGERELTHDPANDRYPSWSPDGRQITLFSNRSGKYQIWSIRPDGSDLRQLTFAPDGVMSKANWSPDGSRIAYLGGASSEADRVLVFEPAKPWTAQTPQHFSRVVEPGVVFFPTGGWSPDGKQLLGDVLPGGVFTYSFASGQFTRLTVIGEAWTWLKDSRRALFTHRDRLFIVDTVSKTTQEVLSVTPDIFDSVALSPDNRTLYFTRETQQGNVWLLTFK